MRALFGDVMFAEGEEYLRFQYRFACAIILCGIVITFLAILSSLTGATQFDGAYLLGARLYLLAGVACFLLLRGRPRRMRVIAPIYAAVSWLQFVMVFFLNPADEMRILWFCLNLPGVYLILGSRAGGAVSVLSAVFVIAANPLLDRPYSVNAVATCLLGMAYVSVFFHAFTARSISFHHAMVEANRRLAEMADRDPLTGLHNARAYYRLAEAARIQAQRAARPLAMLFIDLDHFKRVNDQHGHEAGDRVLKAVARTLHDSLRRSDLVGRIGGEEFSALLPDTDAAGALRVAESLRRAIEAAHPDIGQCRLPVTASIGVAGHRATDSAIGDIQRRADQAMYDAKRQGRNRVTLLDDGSPLAGDRPPALQQDLQQV